MRIGLGINLPGPFWIYGSVRVGGKRRTTPAPAPAPSETENETKAESVATAQTRTRRHRRAVDKMHARAAKQHRRWEERLLFGRSLTRQERKKREQAVKRWRADRNDRVLDITDRRVAGFRDQKERWYPD
jgi:hypothetical protein